MASLEDKSSITTLASEEEKFFWTTFNCAYNWYLKASLKNKLKVLTLMVENLNDESYLNILLSSFNFETDKLTMYSECNSRAFYIYDIKLRDHNRGLDDEFLNATISKFIGWYSNLENSQQITAMIELFKVSGGAILKSICDVIKNQLRNQDKNKVIADSIEEKIDLNQLFLEKKPEEEDKDGSVKTDKHKKGKEGKHKKGKEHKSKKGKKKEHKKPLTPLEIDIEKKKKIWEDEIKKYRISVEGKPNTGKKKGKKDKSSKGKSSKSTKTSKKSGKGKKGEKNLVDQIQMLPIWVVKKIFSYLDKKTLKKVRTVNVYWTYIVDDLAKDKKTMKPVQKILKKMKKNIAELDSPDLKPTGLLDGLSHREKKMMNLADRGAIDPAIRNVIKISAEGKTLLERAITMADSQFKIPNTAYKAFPRAEGNKKDLLTLPKFAYTEAGVFNYGKKPEGGVVTIVELADYDDIGLKVNPMNNYQIYNDNNNEANNDDNDTKD
ncbi:uncharacterized protein PF3D7_1225600-like [Onthophagus taurus]|uniref:uncharacterized protein PF3D7_1225600-like n=1 Tax=Onthophagus taurus TaxID=166361 RepID=UPI0039BE4E7F